MTWNYRIVRYRLNNCHGLHEVYYDKDGQPWGMTQDPCSFVSVDDEGKDDIVSGLCVALQDAVVRPVLEEPEQWPGRAP